MVTKTKSKKVEWKEVILWYGYVTLDSCDHHNNEEGSRLILHYGDNIKPDNDPLYTRYPILSMNPDLDSDQALIVNTIYLWSYFTSEYAKTNTWIELTSNYLGPNL